MSTLYDVIRRPIITEKGLMLKEQVRTLCFEVAPDSSKQEVQQAVERIFKVRVDAVRHDECAWEDASPGPLFRLQAVVEEGIRHPCGRRKDDRVRGGRVDGDQEIQPDSHVPTLSGSD